MTEVANSPMNNNETFGQFMDMVEDFTFPTSASSDNLAQQDSTSNKAFHKKRDWNQASLVTKVFYAMERANLPLIDSCDSLTSFSSSNSLASVQSESDLNATEKFLETLHTLTINNFNSTGNLLTEEERQQTLLHKVHAALPEFVLRFVASYDEFMHNFDGAGESKDGDAKMC